MYARANTCRLMYSNVNPWLTFFIQKAITVQLFNKFPALSESSGIKSNTSIDILFRHISTFLCFTSYFFFWLSLGKIASSLLWLDLASVLYNSDLRTRLFCVCTSQFTWIWETRVMHISCFLAKIITQEYQIRSTDYKPSLCIIFNNRRDHTNNDKVVQIKSDVAGLCLPYLRFRMCICVCMYV
jgi:hypothetical protein